MSLPALLVAAVTAISMAIPVGDDFKMTIQDVFTITGRGLVVTGRVEGGPVSNGDEICLRSEGDEPRTVTVKGVEQFRQLLETAEPGMNVGLLFEDLEKSEVEAGDVLTASCD